MRVLPRLNRGAHGFEAVLARLSAIKPRKLRQALMLFYISVNINACNQGLLKVSHALMAAAGHTPLYLSPFIETHKDGYIKALKAAQQQLRFEDMAGFLADAMIATVDELLVTRSALSALRRDWLTRRNFRSGSASFKALDHLAHYPVLTVSRLAGILDVSFKTASVAVDQLVDARILTERTGYARNRMFAANEALSLINRPFGAEPVLP